MNNANLLQAPERPPRVTPRVSVRPLAEGLGADATSRRRQLLLHARDPGPGAPSAFGGVGLWIDHRKAVIVYVSLDGVHTTLVLSRVDKQPGRIAGRRSTARFESQLVPADDSRDRRYAGQLDLYYDAVIACIRPYRSILVFGPGEAKGELRRRLAANRHDRRVFLFEAADMMTGPQIAAKTLDWLMADRVTAPLPRRRSGRPER